MLPYPPSPLSPSSDPPSLGYYLLAWFVLLALNAGVLFGWLWLRQRKKRPPAAPVNPAEAPAPTPASQTEAPAALPSDQPAPVKTPVQVPVTLAPGSNVRVTVESLPAPEAATGKIILSLTITAQGEVVPHTLPAGAQPVQVRPLPAFGQRAWTSVQAAAQWIITQIRMRVKGWPLSFEATLFALALIVYLATRLISLTEFPIYFFADEAAQTLYAEKLIQQKFRDPEGYLLPIYVEAAGLRWTPLLPMYIHAATLSLFGKSIFVTRATSVLIGSLGALAVGGILKKIFNIRYWWAGVLLLATIPAWLLHSRTAFETVMTTGFYGCFLLFYLLYRCKSPRYLYPALIFGALTFYTYSNAQVIMAAVGIMLLLSDLPYHIHQWRTLLVGLLLAVVLAYPLLIFREHQPEAMGQHLRTVNSYWFQPLSLPQKASIFLQKAGYGLSPQYWFLNCDAMHGLEVRLNVSPQHECDLPRHRMGNTPHILWWQLPLLLIGAVLCLRQVRSAPHRAILIATLAAPAGAALLDIGITRVLAFVIPASILGGLGLDWLLERLQKRLPYRTIALAALVILSLASFLLLRDALVKGPLWFNDYGLYGMQYGAKQLFQDAIPEILWQNPSAQILVSSTWANGTDRFLDFFFEPQQRTHLRMDGIEGYLFKRRPLDGSEIFVMTPSEYEKTVSSPKFKDVTVVRMLPYPNGSPGFYFIRLAYADNVDEIFIAEAEARRQLISDKVAIAGQLVDVRYSPIDMGAPALVFDGDHHTVMRGLEANPYILELSFPEPRAISKLLADCGLVDVDLTIQAYADPQGQPVIYKFTRRNKAQADNDPNFEVLFDRGPEKIAKLRFEFFNPFAGDTANFHIFELELAP
jgi:hypothetical protein